MRTPEAFLRPATASVTVPFHRVSVLTAFAKISLPFRPVSFYPLGEGETVERMAERLRAFLLDLAQPDPNGDLRVDLPLAAP